MNFVPHPNGPTAGQLRRAAFAQTLNTLSLVPSFFAEAWSRSTAPGTRLLYFGYAAVAMVVGLVPTPTLVRLMRDGFRRPDLVRPLWMCFGTELLLGTISLTLHVVRAPAAVTGWAVFAGYIPYGAALTWTGARLVHKPAERSRAAVLWAWTDLLGGLSLCSVLCFIVYIPVNLTGAVARIFFLIRCARATEGRPSPAWMRRFVEPWTQQQWSLPEGARCAVHPEVAAASVCQRCGAFACPECLDAELRLCAACLARGGVQGQGPSARAIATLGLSIVGVVASPLAPVALVLALQERAAIRRNQAPPSGAKLINAARVLAGIGIVLLALSLLGVTLALKVKRAAHAP